MPSRKSPAQIRSELRRAQQKARQSANRYKQAVKGYNAGVRKVNQAVDRYNREARAHNARVRANRRRLQQEMRRLESSARSSTVRLEYRRSVSVLTKSLDRLEHRAREAPWGESDVLDLSVGETANSVAALNALLDDVPEDVGTDADGENLQASSVDDVLVGLGADLHARWHGALFALHPRNPDAARHFCTSAREMLSDMLEILAPTHVVEADDPSCDRTPQGSVSRRARIRFCLRRGGMDDTELENFAENNINNVLALFREFNDGTHGSAGRFTLGQLRALKTRVEDAIGFMGRIGT